MAVVPPLRLVKLTVVQNATQRSVSGAKNWAAVQSKSGRVIVEAATQPRNDASEWNQIQWSGDTGDPSGPNRRSLALDATRKYHVEATLGGVTESVDVWVLWAVVQILTKGTRPAGAARFDPGSRDNSDRLGAVTYMSAVSSVIDEKAGVFVDNMGASGKVAPVATLLPAGVHDVVKSGWTFERQVKTQEWSDRTSTKATTSVWKRDTSNATYLKLAPDTDDKIYDLDAPDLRWGQKSYETHNNFRQWIEWNGQRCSEDAPWYWRARWQLHRDPKKQIVLNDLGTGNIVLPDRPAL
jgi:hypothetical protein